MSTIKAFQNVNRNWEVARRGMETVSKEFASDQTCKSGLMFELSRWHFFDFLSDSVLSASDARPLGCQTEMLPTLSFKTHSRILAQ